MVIDEKRDPSHHPYNFIKRISLINIGVIEHATGREFPVQYEIIAIAFAHNGRFKYINKVIKFPAVNDFSLN
jgi:hypothetical protein